MRLEEGDGGGDGGGEGGGGRVEVDPESGEGGEEAEDLAEVAEVEQEILPLELLEAVDPHPE